MDPKRARPRSARPRAARLRVFRRRSNGPALRCLRRASCGALRCDAERVRRRARVLTAPPRASANPASQGTSACCLRCYTITVNKSHSTRATLSPRRPRLVEASGCTSVSPWLVVIAAAASKACTGVSRTWLAAIAVAANKTLPVLLTGVLLARRACPLSRSRTAHATQ